MLIFCNYDFQKRFFHYAFLNFITKYNNMKIM